MRSTTRTTRAASALLVAALLTTLTGITADADAAELEPRTTITRDEYVNRLRGMWLAESIANWTGLVTELQRNRPPFYTDDDWGQANGNGGQNGGVIDFVIQDVWQADDDTDIEYIFLDAVRDAGQALLTGEQVRQAWIDHIEPGSFIWVANNHSHTLMLDDPYAVYPTIGMIPSNDLSLMIDAQLTTEHFGSMAPGNPVRALEVGDPAIRNTASGYAAHAAQFYTALYSLAPVLPDGLEGRDAVLWLYERARKLIPDTSKSADVIDFVLDLYLNATDVDDWESARDAVYERYDLLAAANGFRYLGAFEGPINLAGGLLGLLFGEGDYRRSVQIGTLSGWDSDNGTATIGGLLGLMYGFDGIEAAFPEHAPLSDLYNIHRTRVNFPEGHNSFTEMAGWQLPAVEKEIVDAGGVVRADGTWLLPAIDYDALIAADNPLSRLDASSGNNVLTRNGDRPTATFSGAVVSGPTQVNGQEVTDGIEYDFSGVDRWIAPKAYTSADGIVGIVTDAFVEKDRLYAAVAVTGGDVTTDVTWTTPTEIVGVRMIEGPGKFPLGEAIIVNGPTTVTGHFDSVRAQVRAGGEWVDVPDAALSAQPTAAVHYELLEWHLDAPVEATGVRLVGTPADGSQFVTIAELEGILPVADARVGAASGAAAPRELPTTGGGIALAALGVLALGASAAGRRRR